MQIIQLHFQGNDGVSASYIPITIYEGNGPALATIYNPQTGQAMSNPINTDVYGNIGFSAVDGKYTALSVINGISVTTYIQLFDTSATTAAASVTSTGPSNVQADIDARPTTVFLASNAGAAAIGTSTGIALETRLTADEANISANISNIAANTQQIALNTTAISALSSVSTVPIYATTAKALSNGVLSYASLVGGSGGTNGTFALGFSGGGGSGAAGYFVVSGGAVVSITLTATGDSYTSAPTISFAASTGLTGASATAVIGTNVASGKYFDIPSASSSGYLDLYLNNAGSAVYISTYPSSTAVSLNTTSINNITETPQVTDFTASTSYAIVHTSGIASPADYTTAVVGGALQVNQIKLATELIGMVLPQNLTANRVIQVDANFTSTTSGSGFGVLLNPSSSTVIDPTNAIALIYRSNGALVAYRQDGSTTVPGLVITTILSGQAFSAADLLTMTLLVGPDATKGTVRVYKNVSSIPVKIAEYNISGMTSGYIGSLIRQNGAATATITGLQITYKNFQDRYFYLNSDAVSNGSGTSSSPFNSLYSLQKAVDEAVGPLNLYFQGTTPARGSFQVQASKYPSINAIGRVGDDFTIIGATQVTGGWAPVGGHPLLWSRTNEHQGISPSNSTNTGIVDITPANQDPAPRPQFRVYNRVSPNSSLATLDAAIPGSIMVDTAAQLLYVKPYNGTDPNTLTLEMSDQTTAFGVLYGAPTDPYWCQVNLANIHCKYAYASNFLLQRCFINAMKCVSEGSFVGYGFGIQDTYGKYYGCQGVGNYADGFNATVTNGTGFAVPVDSFFYDCISDYNSIIGNADGFSNHTGATWHIYGGRARYNGKDGLVPASGDLNVYNFEATGNYDSQIYISGGGNGRVGTAVLNAYNCIVNGLADNGVKKVGFHCESIVGAQAQLNIHGGTVQNCSQAIKSFNTSGTPSDCVINYTQVFDLGGNTALVVNSGGTVNSLNGTLVS